MPYEDYATDMTLYRKWENIYLFDILSAVCMEVFISWEIKPSPYIALMKLQHKTVECIWNEIIIQIYLYMLLYSI